MVQILDHRSAKSHDERLKLMRSMITKCNPYQQQPPSCILWAFLSHQLEIWLNKLVVLNICKTHMKSKANHDQKRYLMTVEDTQVVDQLILGLHYFNNLIQTVSQPLNKVKYNFPEIDLGCISHNIVLSERLLTRSKMHHRHEALFKWLIIAYNDCFERKDDINFKNKHYKRGCQEKSGL